MRAGTEVEIIAGPRKGQKGIVALVADNGCFVEMPDGMYHTITHKNIRVVRDVEEES